MRYNVGIDFGTHQTKVCIEDSLNKRVPVYEFLEFTGKDGSKSVLLPSIVQVNEDDSISYGFTDVARCKTIQHTNIARPTLIVPKEPILVLPAEPLYEKIPKEPKRSAEITKGDWASVLESFVRVNNPEADLEYNKWKQKKSNIERSNETLRLLWKRDCERAKSEYDLIRQQWEEDVYEARKRHQRAVIQWQNNIRNERLQFRYFKQASFNSFVWTSSIQPQTLSIWYLTYVYFCIREKIGYDFTVQLGAPMGASKQLSNQQRMIGKRIWSSACKLAEHYKTLEAFLCAKLDELRNVTNRCICEDGRVSIIPEASAGLLSIRHRLNYGMFLLVDIGGGTTDVGMCSVCNDVLGIHKVYSFNRGLNYVFEEYQQRHLNLSLSDVQEIFGKGNDRGDFSDAIKTYHQDLCHQLENVVNQIISTFTAGYPFHRLNVRDSLYPAINGKPILLCGGGACFANMRQFKTRGLHFSNKILINRSLLRIENLSNSGVIDEEIYPILATAYGLAKPVEIEEELDETPLEKFFEHLPQNTTQPEERTPENDYSLALGTW